jgi:hypothetical protein
MGDVVVVVWKPLLKSWVSHAPAMTSRGPKAIQKIIIVGDSGVVRPPCLRCPVLTTISVSHASSASAQGP